MTPLETGGVLLGTQATTGNPVIEVTHVVGPGPKAIHKLWSFEPDYEFHSTEVDRIYKTAAIDITYLGDWHTHPGGWGFLSAQDRNCLRKIALTPTAHNSKPIMVVLAGLQKWKADGWILRASPRLRSFLAKAEVPLKLEIL